MTDDAEIASLGERGFFIREEAAPAAVSWLPGLVARLGATRPAGIGRAAVTSGADRGDLICWLDPAEEGLTELVGYFEQLRSELNARAFVGLRDCELQLAHYPGGGARYVRHRDALRGAPGPKRRVTAILYLNPDWRPEHGGALRLHLDQEAQGTIDVEPRLGRLVVFLSERIEHEVLPTYAPRLAVTAWYRGP